MRQLLNTEEQILANAQQALDELRLFVRGPGGKVGDKTFALQFQLESLEDMLRVVTDNRLARNLAAPGNINGGAADTSRETLQFIISTVRNVVDPVAASPSNKPVAQVGRSISSRPSPSTGKILRGAGVEEGRRLMQRRRKTSGDISPSRTDVTEDESLSVLLPNPYEAVTLRRAHAIAFRHGRQCSNREPSSSRARRPNNNTTTINADRTLRSPEMLRERMAEKESKGKGKLRTVNSSATFAVTEDKEHVMDDSTPFPIPVRRSQSENGGGKMIKRARALEKTKNSSGQAPGNCGTLDLDNLNPGEISHGPVSVQITQGSPPLCHRETKQITNGLLRTPSEDGQNENVELAPPADGSPTSEIILLPRAWDLSDKPPSPVDDLGQKAGTSVSERPASPTESLENSSFVEITDVDESDEPMSPFSRLSTLARDSIESLAERNRVTRTRPRVPPIALPTPTPPSSSTRPPTPVPGVGMRLPDLVGRRRFTISPRANRTYDHRSNIPSFSLSPPTTPVTTPPGTATSTGSWRDACAACFDPLFTFSVQVRAPCGHAYCKECGINLVNSYMSQESLHPLRCCSIPIRQEQLRPVLSSSQLTDFLQKEKEFKTPVERRVYCPNTNCKQFIKVGKIASYLYLSGKMKCPACSSSICTKCKLFAHHGTKCGAESLSTVQFEALVKQKGWQRCGKCRRVVERTQGCLHMTCLCGYEFCYRCGAGSRAKCGHGVFGNQ